MADNPSFLKPRHLLAGYAAEILTRDEHSELMKAALEDQDVFDQLVAEESWRRVLTAPGVRRELLEALEHRTLAARILDWFRLPQARWAMGAAAAALLAVVLVPSLRGPEPGTSEQEELVAKGLTTDEIAAKVPGRANRELSYGLELWTGPQTEPRPVGEDYTFRSGDEFRIRLEADFPVWVYLFNRAEGDDVYTVVYPATEAEHTAVRGDVLVPPAAGEWLGVDETPEDERLVLVVGTAAWPAFEPGRQTVARAELEAALAELEDGLVAKSWGRSVEEDRVRLRIAGPGGELFFVERLWAE